MKRLLFSTMILTTAACSSGKGGKQAEKPADTPITEPTGPQPPSNPKPTDPLPPDPTVGIDDPDVRYLGGQLTIAGRSVYAASPSARAWPGARKSAMTWTDNAGRFWLFGGYGFGAQRSGRLNDLWSYDRSVQQWTFVAGSATPEAFGTDTYPGARSGAAAWTGKDGRFWMFGGFTQLAEGADRSGYSQDLWVFDPSTRVWTFVSGKRLDAANQTEGVPYPAGRERAAHWVDKDGQFWLFGGQRRSLGNILRLQDLWHFNPDTRAWTLIPASPGPDVRDNAVTWTDRQGALWLFGGFGQGADGKMGQLNDLWRFDIGSKTWEFISGSRNANGRGHWGSLKITAAEQTPSGREAALGWVQEDQLCLFGGWGYQIFHFENEPDGLQDLWCFDIQQRQWTWLAGDNFGKERTAVRERLPGSIGYPGARYGSAFWVNAQAEILILGGAGYDPSGRGDLLQDLWHLPYQHL